MLSFSGSLKIFVAMEPCDMRRGHNGLLALVVENSLSISSAIRERLRNLRLRWR